MFNNHKKFTNRVNKNYQKPSSTLPTYSPGIIYSCPVHYIDKIDDEGKRRPVVLLNILKDEENAKEYGLILGSTSNASLSKNNWFEAKWNLKTRTPFGIKNTISYFNLGKYIRTVPLSELNIFLDANKKSIEVDQDLFTVLRQKTTYLISGRKNFERASDFNWNLYRFDQLNIDKEIIKNEKTFLQNPEFLLVLNHLGENSQNHLVLPAYTKKISESCCIGLKLDKNQLKSKNELNFDLRGLTTSVINKECLEKSKVYQFTLKNFEEFSKKISEKINFATLDRQLTIPEQIDSKKTLIPSFKQTEKRELKNCWQNTTFQEAPLETNPSDWPELNLGARPKQQVKEDWQKSSTTFNHSAIGKKQHNATTVPLCDVNESIDIRNQPSTSKDNHMSNVQSSNLENDCQIVKVWKQQTEVETIKPQTYEVMEKELKKRLAELEIKQQQNNDALKKIEAAEKQRQLEKNAKLKEREAAEQKRQLEKNAKLKEQQAEAKRKVEQESKSQVEAAQKNRKTKWLQLAI